MFESSFTRPDPQPHSTAAQRAASEEPLRAPRAIHRQLIAHVKAAIDAERASGRLYRTRWRKLRAIAADMFRRSRNRLAHNPDAPISLNAMIPSIKDLVNWADRTGVQRGGQKSQLAVDRKLLIDILSPELAKVHRPLGTNRFTNGNAYRRDVEFPTNGQSPLSA